MTVKDTSTKSKVRIFLYFYLVMILLLLLTASSYAWFSRNKSLRVSDLAIYVNAPTGMEISLELDSDHWGQQLSFTDMVSETVPLRPVTWSEADQRFYAAVYGIDGRLTGRWEPLSDERNANRNNYEGYYCIASFYARSDTAVKVSLAPAVPIDGGIDGSGTYLIGKPLWDSEQVAHHNGGEGAENAVRVGIKITRLDDAGQPLDEAPIFYIYEPNCDRHTDGSVGYLDTPAIDGREQLIEPSRIIKQTATTYSEADPVERDVLYHTFGEFTSDTHLFALNEGERVMIQLYFWLEGQDVDCTNAIEAAQIMANVQFKTEYRQQGGMQPIPKD